MRDVWRHHSPLVLRPVGGLLLRGREVGAVTPAEADWVWENVLTTARRSSHSVDDTPALLRSCACQWGPCGWCRLGRSDRCAHRLGTAPLSPQIEDHLGHVAVFRSGRLCVWHCPGPPAKVAEQLDLFRLGGTS